MIALRIYRTVYCKGIAYRVILDEETVTLFDAHRWYFNSAEDHYLTRKENGRKIYFHREFMNCPGGLEVDHRNENKLDNRRCNFLIVTPTENTRLWAQRVRARKRRKMATLQEAA